MRFQLALSTCRVRGLRVCVVVVHVVSAGLCSLVRGYFRIPPSLHRKTSNCQDVTLSLRVCDHMCVCEGV